MVTSDRTHTQHMFKESSTLAIIKFCDTITTYEVNFELFYTITTYEVNFELFLSYIAA